MTQTQIECIWLDGSELLTLSELSRCCQMTVDELDELVDYSALVPMTAAAPERVFSADWVTLLRAADKLRLDFDLDLFTVAIVLGNLKHIETLERQVQQLRSLLPARLQTALNS